MEAHQLLALGSCECDQFYIDEDNFQTKRPIPVSLPVSFPVVDIACGCMHTLVLLNNGHVYSWGCKDQGALGRDGVDSRPGLVQLDVLVDMITAGENHSIFVNSKNQAIFFSGYYKREDDNKELNQKAFKPRLLYVDLPKDQPILKVGSGYNHTVIQSGKNLYCWGDAQGKLIGRMPSIRHRSSKQFSLNSISVKNVQTFWAGCKMTVAACQSKGQRKFMSWGCNVFGQLGHGDAEPRVTPYQIQFLRNKEIKKISMGTNFCLALTQTGQLLGWGQNTYGTLGNGAQDKQGVVQPVKVEIPAVKDVFSGPNYSYAVCQVDNKQKVFSWGMGMNYLLLNGQEQTQLKPFQVNQKLLKNQVIRLVGCGSQHAIFVTSSDGKEVRLQQGVSQTLEIKGRKKGARTIFA